MQTNILFSQLTNTTRANDKATALQKNDSIRRFLCGIILMDKMYHISPHFKIPPALQRIEQRYKLPYNL